MIVLYVKILTLCQYCDIIHDVTCKYWYAGAPIYTYHVNYYIDDAIIFTWCENFDITTSFYVKIGIEIIECSTLQVQVYPSLL